MRTRGQLRHTTRRVTAAVAVLAGLTACADGSASQPTGSEPEQTSSSTAPSLTAEVVQLRRDQVLQRVEVAVRNTGETRLVVESVRLEVPGFRIPGPLPKDSPVFAGGVVNLPVPYDGVDCPATGAPEIGRATVTLRVRPDNDPAATRTAALVAGDRGLLQRIADRECAVERAAEQVDLGFTGRWRVEQTTDGPVAHGELRAELLDGDGLRITQVAGAILYGLRPEDGAPSPLASISPDRPVARVPLVAYAARCDPHTIGEIKKPYEFLVWVSGADGEELALTPEVTDRDRAALQQVCTF